MVWTGFKSDHGDTGQEGLGLVLGERLCDWDGEVGARGFRLSADGREIHWWVWPTKSAQKMRIRVKIPPVPSLVMDAYSEDIFITRAASTIPAALPANRGKQS